MAETEEPAGGPATRADLDAALAAVRADMAARDLAVEAALVAQEHRVFPIAHNLYQAFTAFPRGDPRRAAAVKALLWRILSPGTVAGLAVVLISVVGLLVATRANQLLEMQNERLDQQTHLLEAGRRASLVIEFSAIMEQIAREQEAAKWEQRDAKARRTFVCSRRRERCSDLDAALFPLSPGVSGRVVALSRSYRPYRYLSVDEGGELDDATAAWSQDGAPALFSRWARSFGLGPEPGKPLLVDRPLSPERAQLLLTLVSLQVDLTQILVEADLSSSDLGGAYLEHAGLEGAYLEGANLFRARLARANLTTAQLFLADLRDADLQGTRLTNADLRSALFEGACLPEASDLRGVLTDADTDFVGAFAGEPTWVEAATQLAKDNSALRGLALERYESGEASFRCDFATVYRVVQTGSTRP